MTNIKKYSLDINESNLEVEVGRVANLANGSCVLTLGETVVLATASALFPITIARISLGGRSTNSSKKCI